mmetsp:Transcript_35978/g.86850  ORF Transcript_35978/g.86850 Transcript_35978/m.86850 type:complete len:80 (+) Transcript_35978:134-373(+)
MVGMIYYQNYDIGGCVVDLNNLLKKIRNKDVLSKWIAESRSLNQYRWAYRPENGVPLVEKCCRVVYLLPICLLSIEVTT